MHSVLIIYDVPGSIIVIMQRGEETGPFHVLRSEEPVQRFLPELGLTAYCIVSQAAPTHGESQTHAPLLQAPFSEQSNDVAHARLAPPSAAARG